ncbi:Serine/threonine-protein kinase atg1 [Penicillium macrosclerotiorum]|uniref:Serine/threonine-protein kinase atg1 n=1 Tax=Penicillium macrosclerotiorum TaxID=303699 RepID=UPI002546FD3D|nr:Serine/threonine-protein kinase atg1 [Penicillium macrosclerotiorum]KAJ5669179.1 Serine/threonine-protein kinase atg1 [Penicillium macrosclerotiorum]
MSSQHSRRSSASSTEMTIGPYTRHGKIGSGSFATVYRGTHAKSKTFVAIKSVNLSKLNKKLKDNLSSEIDILKCLHHPHIVALIDCHESTSHIHLVMEFCALGDLSQFIKKRQYLGNHPETQEMVAKYPNPDHKIAGLNEVIVRHFLKQLASALHFLRERNLIHRDIKPQNLLLCPAPTTYRAGRSRIIPLKGSENSYDPATGLESLPMLKIADFGFARSLPSTSLAETLCGSPLYMAPEILRYEKYDAKADLWSVGTVLFEMVEGRPPFRASNHVELLRRIEKGEDRINFEPKNPISDEIKKLIRGLLKRNPVERMNFPEFFNDPVIVGPIPGLVGDDLPQEERRPSIDLPFRTGAQLDQIQLNPIVPNASRDNPYGTEPEEPPLTYPQPHRTRSSRPRSETPPSASPMRRVGSADRPSSSASKDQARSGADTPPHRPSAHTHATAPGRQELVDRHSTATAMERQRSRNTYAGTSKTGQEDRSREERERAAQEVAFERDYVLVEKRAVEVNAFADELAHSPRIQGGFGRGQPGSVSRRATTQGLPSVNSTSPHSKALQMIPGRARADSLHQRQHSYERRYGQSPTSATSAISKALNMASGRLFSMGFSPPLAITKGGRSPPLAYNPFPAYPSGQGSLLLMGDGSKTTDEDYKAVQVIEECATRSDVVYGFAEVKYKQLIPLAPSAQTDQSARPNTGADPDSNNGDDDGLTVDAIVTLSEEALVLYVKALSLLAKSMDIAGAWWSRKNREDVYGDNGRNDSTALAGTRINNVVQWVRSRFNEVLEKAEFVRLKLMEAQRRLPLDHPNHLDNTSVGSAATSTASADVVVSSGVSAEKLMYDRALEMSRAAAINELTGEDLGGCEIAYVTAIRMLEAVLDDDGSRTSTGTASDNQSAGDRGSLDDLQGEDRQVVVKLVSSMRGRLTALRKKLTVLAKRTSTGNNGRLPSSNLVPVSQASGATPPR